MTAYFIGMIDVEDAETYDLYRSFNPALVEAAGGKYIIRGKPVVALEGDDFRSRLVLIEFASEAALRKFYDSPEYARLRPLRHASASSSMAMIVNDDGAAERTAYRIAEFGESAPLSPVTGPAPELGADDIRIAPTLIAVNPVDWKIRAGMLAVLPIELPYTPGCEGVGVVEAVGANVRGFAPGQRVMAFSSLVRGGWFATSVDVAADQCALVPDDMADEAAASLNVALLTASQSIALHTGAVGNALVIGASGAVGSIAVALLRDAGAKVDALCSPGNAEYVSGLGGNVIAPQDAAQNSYDFVYDAGGGSAIEAGYRALAKGGTLVSIVQPVDEARAEASGAKAIRFSVQPNGAALAAFARNHKALPDPRIATVLPLSQINAALHLAQHGRMRGKILVKP